MTEVIRQAGILNHFPPSIRSFLSLRRQEHWPVLHKQQRTTKTVKISNRGFGRFAASRPRRPYVSLGPTRAHIWRCDVTGFRDPLQQSATTANTTRRNSTSGTRRGQPQAGEEHDSTCRQRYPRSTSFKFACVGRFLLPKWRSIAKVDIFGLLLRSCMENSALQDASRG